MNKLFIATTVAALLTPSLAAAETAAPHQFSRDGETYVYTSSIVGQRQVIDGRNLTTGQRFHLVVRNGMVSGESAGRPVSFRVPAATNLAAVETASR